MSTEHLDVLIVGAGLSGVGAAYRIQTMCPNKSYAILEGRADLGGTWDLFRYPGIRSDSDMFTLGYPFAPWTGEKSIATGSDILNYIKETAEKHGIDRRIRYNHRVESASWSSDDARWTVDVSRGEQTETLTCNFLYLCSGYYSYEKAHTPDFPGIENFGGDIVHPQRWPDDLDYTGKKVIVIGSGATAVTLVPAMADQTAHITMLQRSPSYIAALPATDPVADKLREILPGQFAHSIVRVKNAALNQGLYQFCRLAPNLARKLLQAGVEKEVGSSIAIDPNFTPTYNPWDQRLCMAPDGDLFEAIKARKASVVTDRISRFTTDGVELESGMTLDADIVITATGLELVASGQIDMTVDDEEIETGSGVVYRGLMSSDIPNFAWCVGYTNASWTLRADLSSRFVCRFLTYLDRHDYDYGVPYISDPKMELRPILDLTSGYVQRVISFLPKQGTKSPWLLRQNYFIDSLSVRFGRIDRNMRFGRKRRVPSRTSVTATEPPARLLA
jgi:monooxygenase